MIIQMLALLTLALSPLSAHADVSDSGNLLIGGNGVIQGTMTVQGAAFSVGGATFSVAGGSITLGGRLNAAAAGIKWADGTTSTTNNGANVILTATQTFSGANTFLSSVTIGGNTIVQGTMTVQGNAFSVGGSTFSVLGGTVQVGGLLRVSSLGIQWFDGKTSTAASSGGGAGNVVLTATQTFSGANTFTSTLAIAGASNICDGGGVIIASGTLNGTFRVTLTGISLSSRPAHLDYVYLTTTTINGVHFWLNNGNTQQYSQGGSRWDSNGLTSGIGTNGENSAYAVMMGGAGLTVNTQHATATRAIQGRCTFQTLDSTHLSGFCDWTYLADASDGLCGTGKLCGYRSMWNANLAAAPTRLDFCSNTLAPINGLPNCTMPLQNGYWKLCGDGWTSGTQ